jgi:hypothetical protein
MDPVFYAQGIAQFFFIMVVTFIYQLKEFDMQGRVLIRMSFGKLGIICFFVAA